MPRIITKDIINERLADKKIELIGEYLGSKTKTLFRCSHNKEWMIAPWYLFAGRNCSCDMIKGNNKVRVTKQDINHRIIDKNIVLIDEYKGTQKKALFRCSVGHEFRVSVKKVFYSDRGCPHCADTGYNQTKSGYTYIIDFGTFIKYGITNNLDKRLDTHRYKNGNFIVIATRLYESGKDALMWEQSVKTKFGGRYATREQCPDGYTETLSPDLLSDLLDFTSY